MKKYKISSSELLVYLAIICSFLGSGVSLGSAFGFAILPVRVIGIICAFWLALFGLSDKNKRLKIQSIVAAYVYILIVTLFFSKGYSNSIALLLDYLCLFSIFCVILLNIKDEATYERYRNIYLRCVIITILICFYEYITQHHVTGNYSNAYSVSDWAYSYTIKAPTAFLYNPNNVAVLMIIALPLMLEKNREEKTFFKKSVWIVGVILDIAVIFMTGSRGGVVAGAVILAGYFLAADIKLWKKVLVLIVGLAVAFYFSDFILNQLGYGGMLANGKLSIFAEGDGGRSNIRRLALNKVFVNNPLFGSGAGAIENTGMTSAHNTIIEVLCNYGIFGMCIFIFLIRRLLKGLLYLDNKIIPILLAIGFFMSMFIPPTIMTLHVLFIPLALKAGESYMERENLYECIDYN